MMIFWCMTTEFTLLKPGLDVVESEYDIDK